MAQKRTIQFYRNANNYTSREEALKIFTESTGVVADTSLADGEPVIARYVSDGKQYTILGINHKIDGKNNFEIFEGNSVTEADRDNKIQEIINGLDVSDTAVTGQYVSSVSETNGKISVTRVDLPVLGVSDTADTDQFVTAINLDNTDHSVKASRAQVKASGVIRTADEDTTNGITATTVEAALQEINNKVNTNKVAGKVTIETTPVTNGYASSYTVKQGDKTVATINIPKDQFLKAASYVKGILTNGTFTEKADGDPYLKFEWQLDNNTSTADDKDKPKAITYVSVKDLVDQYVGSENGEAKVTLSPDKGTNGAGKSINVVIKKVEASKITLTGYTKSTDSNAIATTDTVDKAIGKIENQIDATNAAVKQNKVKSTNKTISITPDAGKDGTNIEVNIDKKTLSVTTEGVIYVNKIDCGTY